MSLSPPPVLRPVSSVARAKCSLLVEARLAVLCVRGPAAGAAPPRPLRCGEHPKSHAARSLPIPRFLCDLLAEVGKSSPPDSLGLRRGTASNSGISTSVGTCSTEQLRTRGLRGLTPHELRHTAASLAVSKGANAKAVQKMLGHASAEPELGAHYRVDSTPR
jgi:integrase